VALDIHLAGGLGEGEVVGAEPGFGSLPVQLLHHRIEGTLQIRHGDVLVNDHALYLMEHGGVGGIHLVLPVHPAGCQDADGQFHGLHRVDLHRRGLAAEHHPAVLVKIEGVRPVPRGVALLCVEAVKVIVSQFYLRAVQDGKSHAYEDVFNLVQGNVHGVLMPQLLLAARDGDVHRLCLHLGFQLDFLQLFLLAFDLVGQLLPDLIGQLTNDRAFLRRELTHLLEEGCELALFPQVLHPDVFQVHRLFGSR